MLCIVFGVLKSKTPFNIETHSKNQQQGEQKQKEAEIKQQHNKEKKTKRERYISINRLEAPYQGNNQKE